MYVRHEVMAYFAGRTQALLEQLHKNDDGDDKVDDIWDSSVITDRNIFDNEVWHFACL